MPYWAREDHSTSMPKLILTTSVCIYFYARCTMYSVLRSFSITENTLHNNPYHFRERNMGRPNISMNPLYRET